MFSRNLFRFDPARPTFLHSADDGTTGGNGSSPTQEEKDAQAAIIAAEVQKKFDAQSARHSGDLTAALLDQIKKTHAAENGNKTLQTQVNELKQQVPDAEALKAKIAAYEALGTPEELQSRLTKGDAAVQEAQVLQRDQIVREDLKLKTGDLLNALLSDTQIVAEGEGEARKVFAVVGEEKTPWEEFVKTQPALQQALPALMAEEKPAGAQWLQQPSGNEGKAPADSAKGSQEQSKLLTAF